MFEDKEVPAIPGFLSIKEAAEHIKLSDSRVYELIREGRLPRYRAGNTYLIAQADLEKFKSNPTGRLRKSPPRWRVYRGGGRLFTTEIRVQLRPGQREPFLKQLDAIRKGERHTLTGSIARYILLDRDPADMVTFWLVWKDSELPDEATHEREMADLRTELDDLLDWKTAQISDKDGVIYT